MIYFIETIGADKVKIGHSEDVPSRLASLQTACPLPLQLIHQEPGGQAREKVLHVKFKNDQFRGEWFVLSSAIKSYISEYKAFHWMEEKELDFAAPIDARVCNSKLALTTKKVAERLAISVDKVFDLIHAGQIEATNICLNPKARPQWRISEVALQAFIDSRTKPSIRTAPKPKKLAMQGNRKYY